MLNQDGKAITSKAEYRRFAIFHIQKATGQKCGENISSSMKDQSEADRNKVVEMMVSEIRKINPQKTVGSDGVHRLWILVFDRDTASPQPNSIFY